ncbi:hypothetical protein K402DRAFT_423465 [Aulographum hederae CBS 113979]|uniref:Zn(2)-C6 fungal-type domain-containing protein n=1 Tax=Aulographum hederae CBS 113979 TaxID=1176131 RepID=A0A6G1GSE4_9PEZI|nr:hypothetical protein K402DRAFT_423465 [Aulographum hederae CBS 113979]
MPHPQTDSAQAAGRQRARAQLSCIFCRQGKLKCNRGHPCDQCIKRSRESSCNFVAPPSRKKPNQKMKDRIHHLESMVVDLMKNMPANGQNSTPSDTRHSSNAGEDQLWASGSFDKNSASPESNPSGSDATDDALEQGAGAFGRMSITNSNTTSYVGNTHWEAILSNIAEVKAELDNDSEHEDATPPGSAEDHSSPSNTDSGANVLLGVNSKTRTKEALLREMPEKRIVDMMIRSYFDSRNPALNLIHSPTFIEEYAQFWTNPMAVNTAWLALLLGIMSISCRFMQESDTKNIWGYKDMNLYAEYFRLQDLAASALISTDFTNGGPYVLEALMVYHTGVYYQGEKAQLKVWLALAVVIRIALRMGLHRDPVHSSDISVWQGEMRRRCWHLIYQLDTLMSFQMGLPGMIRHIASDTSPPHNLEDSDFSPQSTVLPPDRPWIEITPASYSIAKGRLAKIFAEAADASHAVKAPEYQSILDLETQLERAHDLIPPALRVRPLEQCLADSPDLIMIRFNLELLYQKTRAVLFRRFITSSDNGQRSQRAREVCLDAAMSTLHQLFVISEGCKPGGIMYQVRWYLSSLNMHDFLLASTVVCLILNEKSNSSEAVSDEDQIQATKMKEALERTLLIWQEPAHANPKTHKACKAIFVMLRKVGATRSESRTGADPKREFHFSPSGGPGTTPSSNSNTSSNWDSVSACLFPPSNDNPAQMFAQSQVQEPLPPLDPNCDFGAFENMFDMPMDTDWESWDKLVNQSEDVFGGALQQTWSPPPLDATQGGTAFLR